MAGDNKDLTDPDTQPSRPDTLNPEAKRQDTAPATEQIDNIQPPPSLPPTTPASAASPPRRAQSTVNRQMGILFVRLIKQGYETIPTTVAQISKLLGKLPSAGARLIRQAPHSAYVTAGIVTVTVAGAIMYTALPPDTQQPTAQPPATGTESAPGAGSTSSPGTAPSPGTPPAPGTGSAPNAPTHADHPPGATPAPNSDPTTDPPPPSASRTNPALPTPPDRAYASPPGLIGSWRLDFVRDNFGDMWQGVNDVYTVVDLPKLDQARCPSVEPCYGGNGTNPWRHYDHNETNNIVITPTLSGDKVVFTATEAGTNGGTAYYQGTADNDRTKPLVFTGTWRYQPPTGPLQLAHFTFTHTS